MKEKSCCFTGHRSEKLPKGLALMQLKGRLKKEIEKAIHEGYYTFYAGGAYGWDLIASLIVLDLKRKHSEVKLISVIPFEEQAVKFTEKDRDIYYNVLEKSDEVITLSIHFHNLCYKERNQYMVDHSSKVIAYGNGDFRSGTSQTIRMAEKQGIEIINLYK